DTEVCCEFLEHADFGFVHQVLSYLREREDSMSAVSERLNTLVLWGMFLLNTYGPKYLDPSELQQRMRMQVATHYRYLGRQVFLGRNADFWHLHKTKLSEIGRRLSITRVALAAAACACDVVFNPKRSLESLWRHRPWRPHQPVASSMIV